MTEQQQRPVDEGGVPTPEERIVQPLGETVSGTVVTEVDGAIVVDEQPPKSEDGDDDDAPEAEPVRPQG